jgi:predicted HTH domain antitoxin
MEPTHLMLEIPAEVLAAVKLPPGEVEQELRQELALALYRRQVLAIGPARRLARLSRWEFEELLGQRQIPRHYTAQDLAEDIDYGRGHQ